MERLVSEVSYLSNDIDEVAKRYNLPSRWFFEPDHVAIKCHDKKHYDYEIDLIKPEALEITEAEIDSRKLAAAHLATRIFLPKLDFINVEWLEIMEPKPESNQGIRGVDHAEFLYPNFSEVCKVLDRTDLDYRIQSNDFHSTISVPVNQRGSEFKLSNVKLEDIVKAELGQGISKVIFSRQKV